MLWRLNLDDFGHREMNRFFETQGTLLSSSAHDRQKRAKFDRTTGTATTASASTSTTSTNDVVRFHRHCAAATAVTVSSDNLIAYARSSMSDDSHQTQQIFIAHANSTEKQYCVVATPHRGAISQLHFSPTSVGLFLLSVDVISRCCVWAPADGDIGSWVQVDNLGTQTSKSTSDATHEASKFERLRVCVS